MNYDIAPRTSRESDDRNKSHDGYLPYLNAPRGIGRGYISGSWDEDDRRLITRLKLIFIGACIIVALQLSYVLGII